MPVFSNSLELERRMIALGTDRTLMSASFERLEAFKKRFRDEKYMLMSPKQLEKNTNPTTGTERDTEKKFDKEGLAETLAVVTGTPKCDISFLRLEECRAMPRSKQFDLYELARANSPRRKLITPTYRRFVALKDEDGRTMSDVVHGAIGTRRMTLALDNTFGNAFASLLKHDIVALWVTHFMSLVPPKHGKLPDIGRAGATGNMVEYVTKVLPVVYLPKNPAQWIVFTA
jgi:hypothetical protein